MAKKVYLITRRGLGYRVSKSPPGEGERGVQFESEHGLAWDASETQGGGVSPIVPPYPAPSGFEWAFVTENGNRVVENGNRVIELKRAA